ncbi:hypothetical protein ASJ30_02800 [Janibacter indicus]|uniref:Uncharacterized protein n=1 Tax=Janibacter indicus TaxID=857417 RepID=A0A1L3ME44_9MICO|nr:hypothetical protein ASJ30_02800 [Janibacter indicus]
MVMSLDKAGLSLRTGAGQVRRADATAGSRVLPPGERLPVEALTREIRTLPRPHLQCTQKD